MAMMPELKISGFAEILVGARVSKSGSATPASGDLEGLGPVVKPGASGIQVKIDEVVK
jgi:cytochrome c-type biogenesis protein CcmH